MNLLIRFKRLRHHRALPLGGHHFPTRRSSNLERIIYQGLITKKLKRKIIDVQEIMANLKKRITINIFLLSLISAIFVGCIENRPIKNIVYLNEKLTQSLIDGKEVELDIEVDTTCMNDLILCAKLKQDHRFSKIRYIPFNVNLKWARILWANITSFATLLFVSLMGINLFFNQKCSD